MVTTRQREPEEEQSMTVAGQAPAAPHTDPDIVSTCKPPGDVLPETVMPQLLGPERTPAGSVKDATAAGAVCCKHASTLEHGCESTGAPKRRRSRAHASAKLEGALVDAAMQRDMPVWPLAVSVIIRIREDVSFERPQ